MATDCLGHCGNGPMVLVLPDAVWYSHVRPGDVGAIAAQHLHHGQPVAALLDRTEHPPSSMQQGKRGSPQLVYGVLLMAIAIILGTLLWEFLG